LGVFLFISIVFFSNSNAQEKKEQLWLIGTEVVKPALVDQYLEINKEMLALCNETGFPFDFQLWTSGDFRYYLWYPVNSMQDQQTIEAAWEKVVEKYGYEKYRKFEECIDYNMEQFAVIKFDLSYLPANQRSSLENSHYARWSLMYLKKGKEKEMETLNSKIKTLADAAAFPDAKYVGYGRTGFENPVFMVWSFGKSVKDFWTQDDKFYEILKPEKKEIDALFGQCVRKTEDRDMWWLKNLSYTK